MLIGFASVALAAVAVLIFRPPFRPEDADLISKLELPAVVKRAAVKGILLVSRADLAGISRRRTLEQELIVPCVSGTHRVDAYAFQAAVPFTEVDDLLGARKL